MMTRAQAQLDAKPRDAADVAETPTVYVVADDPATRDLVSTIVVTAGCSVETFETGRDFLDHLNGHGPACLILDVRMPGMGGLAVQVELSTRGVTLPVIVISGYADVPTAVRALRAGAIDFIEKPFAAERLLEGVRAAIDRDRKARARAAERAEIAERIARLSPRESQVMRRVVAGHTNKEIATDLGVCEKTIEVHRGNVMRKMKATRLAELVRFVALIPTATAE